MLDAQRAGRVCTIMSLRSPFTNPVGFMRHLLRIGVLACVALAAGVVGVPAAGPQADQSAAPVPRSGFLTVPPNVRAEGLPPIPASLPEALAPYASSRRALLLDWHPTRR